MAGIITGLAVQKGNRERVNVELDGAYAFALDLFAAAALHKGDWLDDDAITELRRRDEEHRAYLSAVRQLAVRPRSTREIEDALRRKGFDAASIASAVARLQQEGLLDDAEFARYWAENRSEFRPRSAGAIRYELRRKGIGGEEIDAAVEDLDDEAAAWEALARKAESWRRLEAADAERKAHGFLARRGFSHETVRRVWARWLGEMGEEPADDR